MANLYPGQRHREINESPQQAISPEAALTRLSGLQNHQNARV
ncbi:hypothetical protein AAFL31_25960 [Klebsiella huaxiensis]